MGFAHVIGRALCSRNFVNDSLGFPFGGHSFGRGISRPRVD